MLSYTSVLLLLMSVHVYGSHGLAIRERREVDPLQPGNWDSCNGTGAEAPPTRVDTTAHVQKLREYFESEGIAAYIIPNEDAHQSEYPSAYDMRRGFISGFKGSAGFAVVTKNKQALWTDGRYFLEAEDTLDCNWILMRQDESGVPTVYDWLSTELKPGEVLGASDLLLSVSWWTYFEDSNISMKAVPELIDRFWDSSNQRPGQPNSTINALPLQFAGRTWQTKISDMRQEMLHMETDTMIVTGLDETAWLFNLRATDIAYNPFFISYAIIQLNRTRLYLVDHVTKLTATDNETMVSLHTHLNTSVTGTCDGEGMCVEVKDYADILTDVWVVAGQTQKVWLSNNCNYAIYSRFEKGKVFMSHTAVATAKTHKNPTEVAGMKDSHIRDAAALVAFLAKLEPEVQAGVNWTEMSAAIELEKYRRKQKWNRGLSFDSISGSGPNGAIIHYAVSGLTDLPITTSDMYLLDSGGQYLDGTTDVTRTFHFGEPTDYEKECYTRVLMGHIDLFHAVWPRGLYGREIDSFARGPLWQAGLIYRHGTGHGIGAYLSVHEGPGRISLSHGSFSTDFVLNEFQFYSDEPGYYERDKFGIRIENIVMVTNASTKYHFENTQFLTFSHVTLVPYEPKLINVAMLSGKQINYLNSYNKLCRELVGPVLREQGETAGYQWLIDKTEEIRMNTETSGGTTVTSSVVLICLLVVVNTFI